MVVDKYPEDVPHYISLGAGVQSSTMVLMAAHGEITPMPKAAIFADTGDEPKEVYDWLEWLRSVLPFEVHTVSSGVLSDDLTVVRRSKNTGKLYTRGLIPAYVQMEDGSKGLLGRKCTADYKVKPIKKAVRKLANIPRGASNTLAVQWIGISIDEAHRMKMSGEKWWRNRWPLIEARMTRTACIQWMSDHGYPTPPRSACVFCPFHSDAEWRRLKNEHPDEFKKAAEVERKLQEACRIDEGMTGVPFLNKRMQNIDTIDFSSYSDNPDQIDMFGNDCEGLCGV